MKLLTLVLLTAGVMHCAAYCQEADSPSVGLFAGAGIAHDTHNRGALNAGASVDQSFPNHWIGYMFEGGYVGPFSDLRGGSALFSVNYMASFRASGSPSLYHFATAGYTQLFGTGHAANFGVGVDVRPNPRFSVRIEARDYLSNSPHQHNFAVRVGLRRYIWD